MSKDLIVRLYFLTLLYIIYLVVQLDLSSLIIFLLVFVYIILPRKPRVLRFIKGNRELHFAQFLGTLLWKERVKEGLL